MAAIENFDNRPWVPHAIPNQIRAELYRRKLDRGVIYTSDTTAWSDNTWKQYRGPLSSWVRVTSNGTGINKTLVNTNKLSIDELGKIKKDGFVFYGGQGFYDAFGKINPLNNEYTSNILGYDVVGQSHQLNLINKTSYLSTVSGNRSVPIIIPPPGIISIETSIQKERIRKATINWKCYSFAQLEYMTPYFLTPGISVIVEFGWNHFNINSLLNIENKDKLRQLWEDGTPLYTNNILGSNGMYDVTFGQIANFEFSSQDGLTYDCKTEVYSKHRNHSGGFMNEAPKTTETKSEILTRPSFYEFSNQRLKKISKCLEDKPLNFFDPLDSEEEKKFKDATFDRTLSQTFYQNPYSGKKQVEDRICIGRGKIKNDPFEKMYGPPDQYDWDKESPEEVWVTMGFLIELLNLFITQDVKLLQSNNQPFKLYSIDIEDVLIGSHPNLISTDPSIMLVPNAQAPKFNLGWRYWLDKEDRQAGNTYTSDRTAFWGTLFSNEDKINAAANKNQLQTQTYSSPVGSLGLKAINSGSANPYDKVLYKTFATGFAENTDKQVVNRGAYRDDIDSFINRFRYNSPNQQIEQGYYSFPQYKNYKKGDTVYDAGRYGYLKDLYVNINLIINTSKDSKTVEDFLKTILEKITGAVGGFWDFDVVESEHKLTIIDKKFISKNIFDDVYQFDISSDSIVKSITFSGTPSSAQANQVIAGSSNNQGNNTGTAVSTELPNFYYGDRLRINEIEPDKNKSLINESSDVIKQLQKYGKVNNAYFVSLKQYNRPAAVPIATGTYNPVTPVSVPTQTLYKVYNLALPSVPLLLTILSDDDFVNNTNIYGGQQPNFTCELTLQGISGLRTFQCFSIKNLPKPYSESDIIFQIVDVNHSVQNGDWTTTIKAGIRPIRGRKVNFSDGESAYDSTVVNPIKNVV